MVSNDDKPTDVEVSYAFSADQLREMTSFEDVARAAGVVLNIADEMGDGYAILDDKSRLIDIEMLIVSHKFVEEGDYGEFSVLHTMVKEPNGSVGRYIIFDGSTGIHQQMKEFLTRNTFKPLHVKNGLRRSDYTYTDDNGKESPATTYYLDTSA